jgi:hypothetical protein
VEPFLELKPEHFRDIENLGRLWYSVVPADKEASAACLELVGVKHNPNARLEEIKVMRDGVCCFPLRSPTLSMRPWSQ